MDLRDKFTTTDEEDVPDRSAIFYLKERDLRDLIMALQFAEDSPKTKFSGKFNRFRELLKQFKDVLR